MQSYGVPRPPKPDTAGTASALICDKRMLCSNVDAGDVCHPYEDCKKNVTRFVNTNGDDRFLRDSGNLQTNIFLAQHFDILNSQLVDKAISQIQAVRGVFRIIPKWALSIFMLLLTMVCLVFVLPAIVIFVRTMRNTNMLAKLMAIFGLWIIVGIAYFLIPV